MGLSYSERLNLVIPGGAHTYSRGDDQFPSNAPQVLSKGRGAYIYGPEGEKFLDYGMALRAVVLGYAQEEVNLAAIEQIHNGNNLTRASLVELEAAEVMAGLIDSVDMVKFAKNGSSAVSGAVKLARAFTGRELVVRCLQHPFFSYDDWFIGSTVMNKGVPENIKKQTLSFTYNDIASLEKVIAENPGDIACVILEPATSDEPCASKYFPGKTFLHDVKHLCEKSGIVFILDEMITGFRWDLQGAQKYYGVTPDLSTFGKGMANGFSLAAVVGKREIMELGSTKKSGAERVFLLSSTHGAEMSSLGAFIKTVEILRRDKVIEHLWRYGNELKTLGNELAVKHGISEHFRFMGPGCSPVYVAMDSTKNVSFEFRTLFSQEMIKNGVMMPWIALSYAHTKAELELTKVALDKTFSIYAKALESGVGRFLEGPPIKPVFRKYN